MPLPTILPVGASNKKRTRQFACEPRNRLGPSIGVVLKFSKARKRYERQGLLVEAQALEQAE